MPASQILASDEVNPLKDPIQLLAVLEKKRLELEERAKWLELREMELNRLDLKITKRIEALEVLRQEIQRDLAKEKEVDDANIARLAKILSGMKPKTAATSLEELDQETAIRVLKVMRERTAAKIMDKMDPAKAVPLQEELSTPISEKRQRRK